MKITLKSVLVTKGAVFVTSQIRDVFISYQGESISIYFETRLFPKLPSELAFGQSVLKKIQLDCLAYGIVTVKGQVTCITNEVLSSRHDCVFKACFCGIDYPIKLANSKAYPRKCLVHHGDTWLYQILKKFPRVSPCTK